MVRHQQKKNSEIYFFVVGCATTTMTQPVRLGQYQGYFTSGFCFFDG
jgi:hypothetical protein